MNRLKELLLLVGRACQDLSGGFRSARPTKRLINHVPAAAHPASDRRPPSLAPDDPIRPQDLGAVAHLTGHVLARNSIDQHFLKVLGAALALTLAFPGCTAAGASEQKLTVFAAASLTKVFTGLGATFEASHPGVKVVFTFDGSSGLVDQLKGGAKADVFASADEKNMTNAVDSKLTTGTPAVFARNVLTLVTAPGNPKKITGLDDSLTGKKLVVCAVGVPCGTATDQLAKKLGVVLKPVSEETKVTDVLAKVASSGEADAGVVYVTDAKTAGDKVTAVAIKGSDQVVNNYPIAVLADAPQPGLATEFVALVSSQPGKDALSAAGFVTP